MLITLTINKEILIVFYRSEGLKKLVKSIDSSLKEYRGEFISIVPLEYWH